MYATDGDGKAAQNMLTLKKKKVNIPPHFKTMILGTENMAKVTRRTSVPSNGRISFLPRIYEFYIGAWFCLGKEEGSSPSSPVLSMECRTTFAPDL